jgi:signal transduction histidine kinase
VRGVECGADNYITKPYEPSTCWRIRHVIDNQQLRVSRQPGRPGADQLPRRDIHDRVGPAQILALLLSSFEELIRTNAALQESKQRAEAAARARDEVLATVSHDLKNPVGTIYTSATLLLDIPLPPDAQQRQIDIIRRTAQRMDRLIMDLLDVSSMEAGRFSVEPRPESMRSLVNEARELFAAVAAAQEVELRTDIPDDDVMVQADRGRVLQVLSNLIGNAVKFTPGGGSVTVIARREDGHARFTVSDTGSGIAEENLSRIFDRFWHSGKAGGSGLGLAIAQGIVQAHNGRIWVESGGTGTSFHFTLPA